MSVSNELLPKTKDKVLHACCVHACSWTRYPSCFHSSPIHFLRWTLLIADVCSGDMLWLKRFYARPRIKTKLNFCWHLINLAVATINAKQHFVCAADTLLQRNQNIRFSFSVSIRWPSAINVVSFRIYILFAFRTREFGPTYLIASSTRWNGIGDASQSPSPSRYALHTQSHAPLVCYTVLGAPNRTTTTTTNICSNILHHIRILNGN